MLKKSEEKSPSETMHVLVCFRIIFQVIWDRFWLVWVVFGAVVVACLIDRSSIDESIDCLILLHIWVKSLTANVS